MFLQRIKGHHSGHPNKAEFATQADLFEFLQEEYPTHKDGAIYFHVPFCDTICSFCSMNRTKLEDELDSYTNYLLEQIEQYSKFPYIKQKSFESVYFGGGTPTVLKERHLEPIIRAIRDKFNISPTCEFSLETTLHNLSVSKVRMLQNLGVNRFSIGIQTFSEAGRKLLNRTHKKEAAIEHLAKIKEEFSGFVCTDIIYNYPEQSIDEVVEDAQILKRLNIDSTSFYSLMFLDGSVLAKSFTQDYYSLEHDRALHHAFVNEMFKEGEYEFLEYTKINRKGRDLYKYIRLTHMGVDVLPIGVGSGGQLGNFGIFNMKMDRQMIGILPKEELRRKKFVALFQYPNISLRDVKRYVGDETMSELMEFFKRCEEAGYLKIEDNRLNFSIDGVFWGNSIADEAAKIAKREFE